MQLKTPYAGGCSQREEGIGWVAAPICQGSRADLSDRTRTLEWEITLDPPLVKEDLRFAPFEKSAGGFCYGQYAPVTYTLT